MADPQASRFWIASTQSGLLDVQSLTACWEAIPIDKRDALEHLDRRLARQAVQQNHLTLWQAQQLLAGRTSGFRVDRYLLLDLIGHGGMGRVYLARDTRLNRRVALKILSPERMSNPRAIARFQREARVGAQLQHENLVRIYDFGESNGRFFLVMEYIEGKTIGALISVQGPMPVPTAARLVRQIARGLEHAHRKGLIHRDVNPYNVLVTHDGTAKLADLGLAIDLAEDDRVTREGATVGTFDYVAPEQARHSHSADIRSDIYSLGCTFYHMISGQVPFPSPSLPEKLFAHQALEPTPLNQIVGDISPELVEVIRRMMRKQPEERYPTPLHVAQALAPFTEDYADLRDDKSGRNLSIPEKPQKDGGTGPPELSKIEPEETSPMVLEPDTQFAASAANQPMHSVGATALAPSEPSSAVSPILDDRQRGGIPPPLVSPINSDEISSAENIPLFLDLGPEPSLSDSLSRLKPRPGTENSGTNITASSLPSSAGMSRARAALRRLLSDRKHFWLIGLAATLVLLCCLLVAYLVVRTTGGSNDTEARSPRNTKKRSDPGTTHSTTDPTDESDKPAGDQDRESRLPIIVHGGDGQEIVASDFLQAVQRAIGAKGWVEFHNRRPLVIPSSDLAITSATNTWLKLRSAEGLHAVLIVEVKGQKPFLTVGSGIHMVLDGLEIVARYTDQPLGTQTLPPPIIRAAGPAQLERCLFRLKDGVRVAGSRAIVAEGGELLVKGCCFQGLDTAVEVHAIGGSTTQLEETMAIPAGNQSGISQTSPPTSSGAEGYGWGIKMQLFPGGRTTSRRLVLKHCTLVGHGLLQFGDFSPDSPLQVDMQGCAVQATTLVGWLPSQPARSWSPGNSSGRVRGITWISRVNPGQFPWVKDLQVQRPER